MIGLSILIGFLTYFQFDLNESQQATKERALKSSFDSSLTTMSKQSEINNRQTIISITKTQTETLGKYGFMLDSTSNRLVKVVRDSSKTKVVMDVFPALTPCVEDGLSIDSTGVNESYYRIKMCSYEASSAHFDIDAYVTIKDSVSQYRFLLKFPLLDTGNIPNGAFVKKGFGLPTDFHYTDMYFYIVGTYGNLEGTSVLTIDG